MSGFCQLHLTCASEAEARKITKALLDQRLVACVKRLPVTSDFLWQGKTEHSEEMLLEMTSSLSLFDQVEKVVRGLHSYDSFVLEATELKRLNPAAEAWLSQELAG